MTDIEIVEMYQISKDPSSNESTSDHIERGSEAVRTTNRDLRNP